MKRSTIHAASLMLTTLCTLLFTGCYRIDNICHEPQHPHKERVKLTTLWSKTFTGDDAVKADSVYLYLVDQEGVSIPLQSAKDYIDLLPGTYRALATNRYQPSIGLENSDDIYQARAYTRAAGRADAPLHNQAVNFYAAWSEGFTVEEAVGGELILVFYQRAVKLTLHVTVEGMEQIAAIDNIIHGMAESIELFSAQTQGNCCVVPTKTTTSEGYQLHATVFGGSPDTDQLLEITVDLKDNTQQVVVTDLTDVFLTLGNGEYETHVYITLSLNKQNMQFTSRVDSWKTGNTVYGEIN